MKKITQIIAALLLVSALIYSCKKKEDPAPVVENKTPKLTGKTWIMTACTLNPPIIYKTGFGDIPIDDLFKDPVSSLATCAKDDELMFMAASPSATSGTFTRKANIPCDGEVDDAGTWKFNADFTQIISTSTASKTETVFNILDLTNTVLKVNTTMANPVDQTDKKSYTATITFGVK